MTTGAGSHAAAADPGAEPRSGEDRILTLPNAVTTLRLAGVGVFVWLLFGAHDQGPAAILLAVVGSTDWVDGQLARRLHQVSTVGKILDPTVDRVLVGTAVISVMVHGAVPIWFGVATIVREVLISGMAMTLASLGAKRIDVLWVGKAGTFALMFAYPTFLLGHGTAGWQDPIRIIGWVTGGVGLGLAWIALAAYLVPARRALAEGRAARGQDAATGQDAGSDSVENARTGEVSA